MAERIAVVGLGYVGLPVALAMAERFEGTIGFDIAERRIAALRRGEDVTGEADPAELSSTSITFTSDPEVLREATFFIVAVPTPIDKQHCPDLGPVISATKTVAKALRPGSTIVYESTVYPGVTEDICGPILEEISGLRRSHDFKLGYSPERINPGDKEHNFRSITKVVSGEDSETLDKVARIYGSVVKAGVHRAGSIKAAEAAKCIENIQRDLNIALMNELAMIFDRVGIRTQDVLEAASTKWNFLRFEPGLVGGHCIGVDPYYMTTLAEQIGYHPQVILAGRRINEGMGAFVGQQVIKHLARTNVPAASARVGVLGLAFKPDVPDLRNTKVVDVLAELRDFGVKPLVHDPVVDQAEAQQEYGLKLLPSSELEALDALVLAVPHRRFLAQPVEQLLGQVKPGGAVFDVKSALDPNSIPENINYWSL